MNMTERMGIGMLALYCIPDWKNIPYAGRLVILISLLLFVLF